MHQVIAIVGMTGAGKSVVAEYFKQKGYTSVHFGNLTFEELKKRGLVVNEKNERTVRESLRQMHGMDVYAALNLSKIEQALQSAPVIIDDLCSWAEYKFLKAALPSLLVLAVTTSPAIRYQRLQSRPVRPLTREEAASRDYAEIEHTERGGPITMADYTLVNNGTLEELKMDLESIFASIESRITN